MLITPPSFEERLAHTEQARPILLEVTPESPVEESLRLFATDRRVCEIKAMLPVYVGQVHIRKQSAFRLNLLVEWRARYWRIEHELVEVRGMIHRILDLVLDVLRRVMFESHDA